MAYVRKRGNQLAIVHGERNTDTKLVEQQILFTIYSKAEAREALTSNGRGCSDHFRHLLEREYPGFTFNWKAIGKGIADNLDVLPDSYEYRGERLRDRFRSDLGALATQLLIHDPQVLHSSAEVVYEHRHELAYLRDLIDWRLRTTDPSKKTEWNGDNAFFWRSAIRGNDAPAEAEEQAAEMYERGAFDQAEAVFRLLIECFPGYAEGWNYLGLIALRRDDLPRAREYFEQTIEIGRKRFPRRVAKASYWSDLETRPYMRGLRNLALTLNRLATYGEALAICDRLERECGDAIVATSHRAAIYLNTGRWEEAAGAAVHLHKIDPSESLVAAFALFEIGRRDEAVVHFLHGALNAPRTSWIVTRIRRPPPKGYDEVRDHNGGIDLRAAIHGYLAAQSRASRRFFRELTRDEPVVALLEEIEAVVRRRSVEHPTGERGAFDRMTEMRAFDFAVAQARRMGWKTAWPESRERKAAMH